MAFMECKGYHAQIEYDDYDQLFVGSVVGIHDYIGFHGITIQKLEESFKQCIDNYLEFCMRIDKVPEIE